MSSIDASDLHIINRHSGIKVRDNTSVCINSDGDKNISRTKPTNSICTYNTIAKTNKIS